MCPGAKGPSALSFPAGLFAGVSSAPAWLLCPPEAPPRESPVASKAFHLPVLLGLGSLWGCLAPAMLPWWAGWGAAGYLAVTTTLSS